MSLPAGETRTFLKDGDEVIRRGPAELSSYVSIGFGEAAGRIIPRSGHSNLEAAAGFYPHLGLPAARPRPSFAAGGALPAQETEMGIEGKVVAITGASSGIGRATAKILAERGALVVLGAHREDALAEVVAAGGKAVHRGADVRNRSDLEALAALAIEQAAGSTSGSTMPGSGQSRASTPCAWTIGTR